MPDRQASAIPLTQLDLAVHIATKLNRSHLLTAHHSYILPVLGRSEIDMQKSGAQAVTVEDSMSMVHASRGVLKPASALLKSECAVVAGIAQAALPHSVVAWESLVEDYDRIRDDIEAVFPAFADFNQRIRHPGGFHLTNAAAERRWLTASGKANFIPCEGLLEDPPRRLTASWYWRRCVVTINTTPPCMGWMTVTVGCLASAMWCLSAPSRRSAVVCRRANASI